MQEIEIYYRRPPKREDTFVQTLITRTPEVLVTYTADTSLSRPIMINGELALEPGAPTVWFTFPGRWYDIGRFHLRDGTYTGTYSNILTPVEFHGPSSWETTDLYLDHWLDRTGRGTTLDEDEFEEAVLKGWIEREIGDRALAEIRKIEESTTAGSWPPAVVDEWTLERVKAELAMVGLS